MDKKWFYKSFVLMVIHILKVAIDKNKIILPINQTKLSLKE